MNILDSIFSIKYFPPIIFQFPTTKSTQNVVGGIRASGDGSPLLLPITIAIPNPETLDPHNCERNPGIEDPLKGCNSLSPSKIPPNWNLVPPSSDPKISASLNIETNFKFYITSGHYEWGGESNGRVNETEPHLHAESREPQLPLQNREVKHAYLENIKASSSFIFSHTPANYHVKHRQICIYNKHT